MASLSRKEGIARPDAFVSMLLAQMSNDHGVPGDATNPKYSAGTLRAACSGSELRNKKDVIEALRSLRKQLETLRGELDWVID